MREKAADGRLRIRAAIAVAQIEAALGGMLSPDEVDLLDVVMNPWLLLPGMFGVDPFKYPWLRLTKLKRAVDDELYRIIADARSRAGRLLCADARVPGAHARRAARWCFGGGQNA